MKRLGEIFWNNTKFKLLLVAILKFGIAIMVNGGLFLLWLVIVSLLSNNHVVWLISFVAMAVLSFAASYRLLKD
jgi:hypothetical protein